MKTPKNFFKNLGKIVIVLSVLMVSSCSDDDDNDDPIEEGAISLPAELVKTYTGNLLYTPSDGTDPIMNIEGAATISSSDNEHFISFSDNIPTLNRVSFIQTDETVYETNFGAMTDCIFAD